MNNLKKKVVWENVTSSKNRSKQGVANYCKEFNVLATMPTFENGNVIFTTYVKGSYEDVIVKLIREKYTINEEFALINKGVADATNVEYVEYRDFVESCKSIAKEFVEERNAIFGE